MSVSVLRQHKVMEDAIRAIMGAGTPPTMTIGSTYASIVFPQGYTVPDETTLTNKYNELIALEADRGFMHVSGDMVVTSNLEVGESNLFVDTTTGKIGVGTTTPSYKLHVSGDVYATANVEVGGELTVSGNATVSSNLTVSGNATVSSNLTVSGNVGCGTSSPQQNLHVHESGSGQVVIAVTNDTTGGGDNDGIHFGIDSSEQGFVWHKQNTALLFATNNAERMRLTNDGKLGIGTISPSGVLHVVDSSAHGSWNKLLVRPTTLWGDGVTTAAEDGGGAYRYMTMANIMLQNPHVCTSEVGGNAHIRIGRGGGVSTGEWWDLATRTDNKFHICKGADDTKGIVIDTGGRVGFGESEKRNLFYAPTNWSYSTSSTGGTILWSFTYNFPYDGYCIFNTNGHFNNSVGNQWVYAKVVINSAGTANTSGYYDSYTRGGAGDHGGDFHAYKDTSVSWQDFNWGGTLKVSAGNRTIGLHVKVSGGTVSINGAAINMFYIPTKIF